MRSDPKYFLTFSDFVKNLVIVNSDSKIKNIKKK